jgi:hypothetical protein
MTDPTEKWQQAYGDMQAALLDSGALDQAALRALRGDTDADATQAWVLQQGTALLAVSGPQGKVYPAFQFTEAGDVRPELAPHVATLQDSGVTPWITWRWLTEPASLLSGEIPHEVMVTDPRRAATATERYAERRRSEDPQERSL